MAQTLLRPARIANKKAGDSASGANENSPLL